MNKILLVISLFLILSCKTERYYKPDFRSEYDSLEMVPLLNNLTRSFNDGSIQNLDSFLISWEKNIPAKDSKDLEDSVEKYVYGVFKEFYTPFDLKRIIGIEPEETDNPRLQNIVIQNSINYTIKSPRDKVDTFYVIQDFRPKLKKRRNARVLFLTPNYDSCITRFLDDKHLPFGTGNIMNPALGYGETRQRQIFLNNRLSIIHGHWGGYWHIPTQPEISYIEFNLDFSIAIVYFRYGYEGGESRFERKKDKWKMTRSEITWIE
jgi:hypothetical protein